MAKLWKAMKKAKESAHGNRFLSSRDMAEIKHQEAVYNSEIKRGDRKVEGQNHYITLCGCGIEGCTIHGNYKSISKEEQVAWEKRKKKHHYESKAAKREKARKENIALREFLKSFK